MRSRRLRSRRAVGVPGNGRSVRFSGSVLEYLRPTTGYQVLIQTPHAPVITLTDRHRATATTTIHELVKGVADTGSALNAPGDDVNLDQYGIYFDDVARLDGEWKFTHRRFVPYYLCRDAVTGSVLTQRSSLLRTD